MTASERRLIALDEQDEWDSALRKVPHAFAHTWTSCHAAALTTGWPTFLWTWNHGASRVVCAFSERGHGDEKDIVTPYGFGGFSGTGTTADFLDDWFDLVTERRYVCGYLGLNPLFAPGDLTHRRDFVEHNEVHVLDLTRGIDALRLSLSRNRRRELAGFGHDGSRIVDGGTRLSDFFLRHIGDFLRTRGASPVYDFSAATWAALLGSEEVFLLGVEGAEGDPVAACLFAHTPYCGEALFSVNPSAGAGFDTALHWAGMTRLSAIGVPRMNLGGGVHRGDGIDRFKRRFGGQALPLGALRQVYRPEVFTELTARAGVASSEEISYFPPYRLPRAHRGPLRTSPDHPM